MRVCCRLHNDRPIYASRESGPSLHCIGCSAPQDVGLIRSLFGTSLTSGMVAVLGVRDVSYLLPQNLGLVLRMRTCSGFNLALPCLFQARISWRSPSPGEAPDTVPSVYLVQPLYAEFVHRRQRTLDQDECLARIFRGHAGVWPWKESKTQNHYSANACSLRAHTRIKARFSFYRSNVVVNAARIQAKNGIGSQPCR